MEYLMIVGYVPGSMMNVYDEAFNREEEHEFPHILNNAINGGAKVLWDTYKIFKVNGMVFASVLINTEAMDELDIPIMSFDEKSIGDINPNYAEKVIAVRKNFKQIKKN